MYLIDTNICIYIIKQKPPQVLKKLNQKRKSDIYISAISVAELEYGVSNSDYPERNKVSLISFLSIFNILNFDDIDASEFGNIKSFLRKAGKIIGTMDLLLASQARARNLTLVTNNIKEFERVPNLKLENWV